MKEKKLGFLHIIITYIWLPLATIVYLISTVIYISKCITASVGVYLPFAFANFTVFICSSWACVALIKQSPKAYFLIHASGLSWIYNSVIAYILILFFHNNIWQCIPVGVVVVILIFIAIHKYYNNRFHLLNNEKSSKVLDNCENIIVTGFQIFSWILSLIVYSDSVYYMFQEHIGYGLFGLFVPVVSQIVYLFDVGFASHYAFLLYITVITFILSMVIGIFDEPSEPLANSIKGEKSGVNNLNRLYITIERIIDTMEAGLGDLKPNCKPIIMDVVKTISTNSENEAANWDENFNYEITAYKSIYNISCDLLSSGRFHIYRGELNPMNESSHLYAVAIKCLDWYKEHGIVDEDQYKDQIDILNENISMVG